MIMSCAFYGGECVCEVTLVFAVLFGTKFLPGWWQLCNCKPFYWDLPEVFTDARAHVYTPSLGPFTDVTIHNDDKEKMGRD